MTSDGLGEMFKGDSAQSPEKNPFFLTAKWENRVLLTGFEYD
jgi:hypothetical protein